MMADALGVRLVGTANELLFSSLSLLLTCVLLILPSPNAQLILYADPSLSIPLLVNSHFWLLNAIQIFPVQSS